MSSAGPPACAAATLERVIPVAQQLCIEDVVVTVTTLERYAGGLVINLRVDWVGRIGPMPSLVWRVDDGRGTAFTPANCGGSGGGGRPVESPADARPHSWRMHCFFAPAIALEATMLTLELAAFRLSEPIWEEHDPRAFKAWQHARELTELGHMTVALR